MDLQNTQAGSGQYMLGTAGMKKQLRSHPRKFGKDSRGCRVTGSCQGLIRKYGINMSRRTFREHAELIGFQKNK